MSGGGTHFLRQKEGLLTVTIWRTAVDGYSGSGRYSAVFLPSKTDVIQQSDTICSRYTKSCHLKLFLDLLEPNFGM